MVSRRESLKLIGAAAGVSIMPGLSCTIKETQPKHQFRYCLNTSTIRGQEPGLEGAIRIAAEAGYDGVELWVNEVKSYRDEGNDLKELSEIIRSSGLKVEGAIGFAPWIVNDDEQRRIGFLRMEEEMNMMAELGCTRIAAPPSGSHNNLSIDFQRAAERFSKLLGLGRKTGVMPHLEFWGSSPVLWTLGQTLNIAAATNDPDLRILLDVYQLFRGGSGFHGLKLIRGSAIEIFHMNDYPGDVPREEQTDAHRVYPGDGAAPVKELLSDLHEMGGVKVLSLEVFNREYWKQDALKVAVTGLQKMKTLVNSVIAKA